ncbi:MAG: ComF family protein [Gallionella sp.]|nr:ComF family protein [Gallionella sp.]
MSILRDTLLNIRTTIEQLLPAQPCVLCGRMSHDGLWCAACDRTLPRLTEAHCPACALPTPTGELCGHCLTHPMQFSSTTAAYTYAFPLDRLIQAMKYREQLALADAFAAELVKRIGRLPDCVIAMPLHPAKLRERGFNQSLLLAASISRALELELLPHACRRIRDTPPQSALPFKERKKNVRDAFCCDMDLSGKHVALVDDVLTTGASLNSLAVAVKKRGAGDVSSWVVARTIRK